MREIYRIGDADLALGWVTELADSLDDHTYSPEVRQLGRTRRRWAPQIAAWRISRASNGPVNLQGPVKAMSCHPDVNDRNM